jgi:hypothetical protein
MTRWMQACSTAGCSKSSRLSCPFPGRCGLLRNARACQPVKGCVGPARTSCRREPLHPNPFRRIDEAEAPNHETNVARARRMPLLQRERKTSLPGRAGQGSRALASVPRPQPESGAATLACNAATTPQSPRSPRLPPAPLT